MSRKEKTIGQTERNAGVTRKLYSEKLNFLDGVFLRHIDITIAERQTAKKVRRIVEKRMCQHYFRQNKKTFRIDGNRSRHQMDRATSYELYTLGLIEGSLKRDVSSHWKKDYDPILGRVVLKKKVGYNSYEEAHKIAIEWNFTHPDDPDPVYPYYCPYCNKYHIGHTFEGNNVSNKNII